MASRVTDKIKLTSIDELLGVPESIEEAVLLDVNKIVPFANHPFRVVDDERMEDLVESIKVNGVLNPVIVRPIGSGKYEMLSGHRRLHASMKLGLEKIPAFTKQLNDDEATVIMVDANIQREELLPSEKAYALKMKMDAIRHQGTCRTECEKSSIERRSCYDAGEAFGIKGRQVQKYIRLTYLNDDLLKYVDERKLPITMAVDISYFDESVQQWIYEYIHENGYIKQKQIDALKNHSNLENVTQYTMIAAMNEALPENRPLVRT